MELESGSPSVGRRRLRGRRRASGGGTHPAGRACRPACPARRVRTTEPDTPLLTRGRITLAKAPVRAWLLGAHDVSKPSVTVASWRAERMGPMTIGAPHRGQCQAGGVEDVSEGIDAGRSRRRASARRAVRHVLAR